MACKLKSEHARRDGEWNRRRGDDRRWYSLITKIQTESHIFVKQCNLSIASLFDEIRLMGLIICLIWANPQILRGTSATQKMSASKSQPDTSKRIYQLASTHFGNKSPPKTRSVRELHCSKKRECEGWLTVLSFWVFHARHKLPSWTGQETELRFRTAISTAYQGQTKGRMLCFHSSPNHLDLLCKATGSNSVVGLYGNAKESSVSALCFWSSGQSLHRKLSMDARIPPPGDTVCFMVLSQAVQREGDFWERSH